MKLFLPVILPLLVVALCLIGFRAFLPSLQNRENAPFDLPKVTEESLGKYTIKIPSEPTPSVFYHTKLVTERSDADNPVADSGDVVRMHYQMTSWSSGKIVDSSHERHPDGMDIQAGVDYFRNESDTELITGVTVPNFLSEAVLGTQAGERHLVIFPKNTYDLPPQYEIEDAYVLVTDTIAVIPQEDYQAVQPPTVIHEKEDRFPYLDQTESLDDLVQTRTLEELDEIEATLKSLQLGELLASETDGGL